MSKHKNWSDKKVEQVKTLYGSMPIEELALLVEKPMGCVYYILAKEGIPTNKRYWTDEEVELLGKLYPSSSNKELSKRFLRDEDAIQLKAASLGIKKDKWWDEDEREELQRMKLAGFSQLEMAEALNRDISSVHNQLQFLGLTNKLRRFTQEELDKIESMATRNGEYTAGEIAHLLDNNISSEQVLAVCSVKGWHTGLKRIQSKGEETLLFILKDLFPNENIISQFHIGEGLRLDFFMSERNIGWEYDGNQHFQEVSFFKGTLESRIRNDLRKESICQDLGISLIRIRYDEPLTSHLVAEKIKAKPYSDGSDRLDLMKKYGGARGEKFFQRLEKREEFKANEREYRRKRYQILKELKKNKDKMQATSF